MALDSLSLNSNSNIRAAARESLKGKWGLPIGFCFIIWLILGFANSIPIAGIIITGPIYLGMTFFFLAWVRGENADIDMGFKGFNQFGNSLGLFLLQGIFIFLWSLLLIIPGIIKSFAYSQCFYIMADYPEMGPMEALTFSQDMMKGAKAKLFCLQLHFALLSFLCLFTLGIGFFWLVPFMQTANAQFYEDLKANYVRAV